MNSFFLCFKVRLLEFLDNELGTFLIRKPQEKTHDKTHVFTLSYLDYDTNKYRHTKNYRVLQNENGEYYITSKKFKTLNQLVRHFRGYI